MAKLAAMKTQDKNKMLELYKKWQSSGQTIVAFALQQEISKDVIYYWFGKFKKQTQKKSFSQIKVGPPSQAVKSGVIINFPSGVSIEFTDSVSPDFIKQLIS